MGLDLGHLTPIKKPSDTTFLDCFSLEQLKDFPEYIMRHSHLIAERDLDEFGKDEVIYFESKGYQRKGMRDNFYSDFKNDGLYFDLKSVKRAFNYLEADHISTLDELQANFQTHFIDNFIEGESIFHVSW